MAISPKNCPRFIAGSCTPNASVDDSNITYKMSRVRVAIAFAVVVVVVVVVVVCVYSIWDAISLTSFVCVYLQLFPVRTLNSHSIDDCHDPARVYEEDRIS
jgi:hypothetical protein